ncbi:hypothetical protein [Gilliamella sp. Pas-s95]|uniref:hypothetical protein n=1 Tax=Gilliamella sp. Pas-s95 TaxID=2687317 RepID=UPI0013297FA2|nr:hypothetical protein [Gilliamella sp. Pas-s95]MWN05420.1 hypothetical protein [Gilliamella sp. Pas-s95]
MKKIFLVAFLGIILSGCGEKRVSDEMFVGEWSCKVTYYASDWSGNGFEEFKKKYNDEYVLMSFKYENNSLYSKNLKTGHWDKESLVETYDNKTKQEETDYFFSKKTRSLQKESNDKFILTYVRETITKDIEYSSSNNKIKEEANCTRMK